MQPLLLVGLGGFLGAISRYLVGSLVTARLGNTWPWGTFLINVTGCFAIGFFLTLAAGRPGLQQGWRFFFPIGFVGAYTTFSTYAYETVQLVEAGEWVRAMTYVVASSLVGFAAVVLALSLARR